MNWKKLKEKFPNSEPKIREHLQITRIETSRELIDSFLKTKGYNIGYSFIGSLKEYERSLSKYIL